MRLRFVAVPAALLCLAACNAKPAPPSIVPATAPLTVVSTQTPAETGVPLDATSPPALSDAAQATAPPPPTTMPPTATAAPTVTATPLPLNPLSIEYLRGREYPGSDIKIEQTLTPGANYDRFVASYLSDGNKIYGLLTVPRGTKPATGWPVILFNHGYIPPSVYRTTERYVAYVDAIARAGYIVFKSDYRGHGSSEGQAKGGYGTPDYTIDVLNALASIKRLPQADANRIGMWGHSMGGQVTLRSMVIAKDIKAGVIWAGVVGSYSNLLARWHARQTSATPNYGSSGDPDASPLSGASRRWRQQLMDTYGSPETNPAFWESISPNSYVADLSGPLQLHHDLNDHEVPYEFSQELLDEVHAAGGSAELFSYPGDDHNIAQNFTTAMQRSIAFFDKYVKQAQ